MNNEQLLAKFLELIPINEQPTKQLFVVAMIGLPGVGKTTFAKALHEKTGIYITSNDVIRRFLNKQGYPGVTPVQETAKYIAENSSKYLYEHNISHVIDGDILNFYDVARKNAMNYGARFYLVELTAPEELVRERIQERQKNTAEGGEVESLAGLEEFAERKQLHGRINKPNADFVINSEKELDPQIDDFIQLLKSEGSL